jgi:hypothetical protein
VEGVIAVPKLIALIDRVSWAVDVYGAQCRFDSLYAYGAEPHDPHEMLETFLRTNATDRVEVANFLRTYGEFYGPGKSLSLTEFAEWQQRLRQMRLHAPSRWKKYPPIMPLQNLAFQMEWKGDTPHWRLEATACVHAMAAVIHLDCAQGLRFGRCASPTCRRIFPKLTKHKKSYCDRTCQHRDVVRNAALKAGRRARQNRPR